MRRTLALRLLAVGAAIAVFASPASARDTCIVLDTELQGRYEGGCTDGLADGPGHARGSIAEYRGEFRAGRKHGRGRKTWLQTGDTFEGLFRDDLKHGEGVYRWGPASPWAGERYAGEYRDDRRHGTGTYTWSSGDSFTGPWENDLQTGLQTPMQQQRTRASKAALAAIGTPGARVCGTAPMGIAHRRAVEGEVDAVIQDRLLIRVTKVDGVPAVRQDIRFWDIVMNWRPCRRP
jgi:hypothetical protein